MVMTEREQDLLDEIDRLRRFNNKLSEAARGRFVFCEVDTQTTGRLSFHVLAAPDASDERTARSLVALMAPILGLKIDDVHMEAHAAGDVEAMAAVELDKPLGISVRPIPRVRYINASLVPRHLCEPSHSLVLAALEAGEAVPGAELFFEDSVTKRG